MGVPSSIDTVVIGAGHSGLVMSRYLQHAGVEHVVLERRTTLGGGWQDRWDEFGLVSPNFFASFPDAPYLGPDPDGFMPRESIVNRVAGYAVTIGAPVVTEAEVTKVSSRPSGGFRLETNQRRIDAGRVVVAAGSFHLPRIPQIASTLPKRLHQLHSHHYRNAASLPDGAVLVVGTGQSGAQLAEELAEAGRRVYLSVGSAGRAPRRYRGRDLFRWLAALGDHGEANGTPLMTVDRLPDPMLKYSGNPHLSGHHGGHDTNLRQFAASGMTLIGRIEGADGERLSIADDLPKNLAWADRFFDERFRGVIDSYIERARVDAPPDDRQSFDFEPPAPRSLDLDAEGITTVLWTSGYRLDYRWVDLPIFDDQGYPRNRRGVTDVPGLFFLGLLWQHNQLSATLYGPRLDAPHLMQEMGLPVREEAATPV